jgi:hypothetical protein
MVKNLKIKYVREITGPNEVLLMEINERVEYAIGVLKNKKLSNIDLKALEIDKESLSHFSQNSRSVVMANNLISKIEFILEESK